MKRLGIDRFYVSLKSALRNPKSTILPCALFFVLNVPAEAQHSHKVPRIGLLISASTPPAPWIDAFRQGLRELGYIEGKNIVLEIRGSEAKPDRVSDLAAELVHLKVDIIVAVGIFAVRAAMKATSTIPIVMRTSVDPVRMGFVASLAHPGRNITGLASITTDLSGKLFELLAQAVPGVKRIAVLTSSQRIAAGESPVYKELEAVARALRVKLQILWARDLNAIDDAFVAITKERAQALIVIPSPVYIQHREHIYQARGKASSAGYLFPEHIRREWRPYVLRRKQHRRIPPCGCLCAQDLERSQTGRSARRTTDKVRAGDQSQNSKDTGAENSWASAHGGRQGD